MNNLRKLTVISMVTAILLCTCIASSVAEVLSFSPGVNMDNVSTAFLQEHPNVELITDGIWYDMRFLGKALCQSLLFILLLTGTARGETSVYFAGCDPNSPEYAAFVEMHPDVSVQTESNVYYTIRSKY